MRLSGKVALVTGAGMGIGRATALRFGQEGASVVVADVNAGAGEETVALIRKGGGTAIFVHGDVSKTADCERMIQACIDNFGRIDVLHNNAGIAQQKPIIEQSEEDWDRMINTNLKGTWNLCRMAIPHMQRQGGGSIINCSSVAGVVGFPGSSHYCASKGGVIQMTKAIALEHAKDKIRANSYCPGVHATPMVQKWLDEAPDYEAAYQSFIQPIPLNRFGTADEVANLVLFLASDESTFCTGANYMVDGGFTAH